jgi:hypothetical protein
MKLQDVAVSYMMGKLKELLYNFWKFARPLEHIHSCLLLGLSSIHGL